MNTEQFNGHTPGPWEAEHVAGGITLIWVYDDDAPYAVKPYDAAEVLDVDARLIAAAPDLLAEVKEWREECEAQQAYARALHAQLARATEWAYQLLCYDKSKMELFDNHVWPEENAP